MLDMPARDIPGVLVQSKVVEIGINSDVDLLRVVLIKLYLLFGMEYCSNSAAEGFIIERVGDKIPVHWGLFLDNWSDYVCVSIANIFIN
jgi:hypothetical protein